MSGSISRAVPIGFLRSLSMFINWVTAAHTIYIVVRLWNSLTWFSLGNVNSLWDFRSLPPFGGQQSSLLDNTSGFPASMLGQNWIRKSDQDSFSAHRACRRLYALVSINQTKFLWLVSTLSLCSAPSK